MLTVAFVKTMRFVWWDEVTISNLTASLGSDLLNLLRPIAMTWVNYATFIPLIRSSCDLCEHVRVPLPSSHRQRNTVISDNHTTTRICLCSYPRLYSSLNRAQLRLPQPKAPWRQAFNGLIIPCEVSSRQLFKTNAGYGGGNLPFCLV